MGGKQRMETLAFRLAEARKNCGMPLWQIAEKLFITTHEVSLWECGDSVPKVEQLPVIAEMYGVTTDWLLSGKKPSAEIVEVTSNVSDRIFNETKMATYVSAYCNAKSLFQTRRALAFAKEKHQGQFRRQGHSHEKIPYISHPLTLTCHALALGLEDDDLLSACLLHDVCEDCDVEIGELPVNDTTKEAVRLLTKQKDYKKTDENQKAYYDGIAKNRIALIVKLLDRCNNISNMANCFSDRHMAEYIKETQEYINPLMDIGRDAYPEYSNQFFLIRYHMNSVVEALRHHMLSNIR